MNNLYERRSPHLEFVTTQTSELLMQSMVSISSHIFYFLSVVNREQNESKKVRGNGRV